MMSMPPMSKVVMDGEFAIDAVVFGEQLRRIYSTSWRLYE